VDLKRETRMTDFFQASAMNLTAEATRNTVDAVDRHGELKTTAARANKALTHPNGG